MNDPAKPKDNEKEGFDLPLNCLHGNLELRPPSNGMMTKPKEKLSLTYEEAKLVYRWIKELKCQMAMPQIFLGVLMSPRVG